MRYKPATSNKVQPYCNQTQIDIQIDEMLPAYFFFPFSPLSFFPPANISRWPAFCAKLRSVFATSPEVSFCRKQASANRPESWHIPDEDFNKLQSVNESSPVHAMAHTLFNFCALISEAFFGAIWRGPGFVRAALAEDLVIPRAFRRVSNNSTNKFRFVAKLVWWRIRKGGDVPLCRCGGRLAFLQKTLGHCG